MPQFLQKMLTFSYGCLRMHGSPKFNFISCDKTVKIIVKQQLLRCSPGEKFSDLAFLFRRGERTLSGAVYDTCQALLTAMKGEYLRVIHFHLCLTRTVTLNKIIITGTKSDSDNK